MPTTAIVACPSCGQRNRVRVLHRSTCGNCKASLPIPSEPLAPSDVKKTETAASTDTPSNPISMRSAGINKWKVFGLTVVSWLALSVLARLYLGAMIDRSPSYSMLDAQGVVWSWASLVMSVVLALRLRDWREIVWGVGAFIVCLLPLVGLIVGIGYFAWSFGKVERLKLPRDAANQSLAT